MNQMSSVKRICISAVCIALCCVLPMAFHAVGLGSTFCPMHIPVLLCGMLCGGSYGLLCGIVGPLLSSLLTGMPGVTGLITMVPELMVYGLISGIASKRIRTRHLYADLVISLVVAMVAGRVVGGIASAIFYLGKGEGFGIALWATSYFVTTLPGILVQLILIPILVVTLTKAKVIPARYPAEKNQAI